MRFVRKHNYVDFVYSINRVILNSIEEVGDFDAIYNPSLPYTTYINITNSALKLLSFVKRFSQDFLETVRCYDYSMSLQFDRILNMQALFVSIIFIIYQIEKMQHKFLRFACYRSENPISQFDHDYSRTMLRLNLLSLESHRRIADAAFIHNIITSNIDCSNLLPLINFNAYPRFTRNAPLFRLLIVRIYMGIPNESLRIYMSNATFVQLLFFFD